MNPHHFKIYVIVSVNAKGGVNTLSGMIHTVKA